ncbi:hypothetical protein L1987_60585 [Smallanthus sonchifolius]|uniref:Uncharacterized protein n=1 Tax=Smallanthus sonchifolius TaxID=185202 RepID=A0ACB9D9B1_9ASTR|nr:hypothetical protein L1987_60585 [Smallanthus sonchifolius]
MISKETLQRNSVMQRRYGDKVEGEMDKLAMEEAGFRNCVVPGELTVVPNSGKSECLYGKSVERMSEEELEIGKQWLSDTFHLIRCENDCLPSINWVLGLAKAAVLRHGVNGLVIDPYDELDHQRPSNQTETEYVSQMLSSIKRFAQHHSCHVWFVAHPKQVSTVAPW